MRKGFSFLNSYKRIYEKLQTAEQKTEFIEAIMSIQFLEKKPDEITFDDPMLDLAFEGVKHSLQSSIEGYLNKAKEGDYKGCYEENVTPCQAPYEAPCQQEEEKEEEKEKGEVQEEEKANAPARTCESEDLPEWLDKNAWSEWLQYRKELRKKMTPSTVKQQLSLLENFKDRQGEIINTSIRNGWQGLFEPKTPPGKSSTGFDDLDQMVAANKISFNAAHTMAAGRRLAGGVQ
ncbi:hypothetical protein WCX49_11835 [Sulfurimonas sp. HSL-1656]|uniref:hypothetical protein n=1 Tax=Thiomicrolovo subterrani TaxID=3131934 RepID=UPI0031F7B294